MAERNWTSAQRQCIYARGGTLLVSAAAGSGKTAVLVQRIIELITDPKQPVDVSELLVVTFTKAAAAEMKQRLSKELSRLIAEQPDSLRLQRQLMLLPAASISTVDGFCSALLRDNFYLLGLSPQFKVAEDTQTKLLREEALQETLEEAYAEGDPAFLSLSALLASGRNDKGLAEKVDTLYGFIQSHPFPEEWLDKQVAAYNSAIPAAETDWGRTVLHRSAEWLEYAAALCRKALRLCEQEERIHDAYTPMLTADVERLTDAARRIQKLGWDEAAECIANIHFDTLGRLWKYEDEALKERVQNLRKKAKKQIENITKYLCFSEAEHISDMKALRPIAEALCMLVRHYAARFAEKKREQNLVDFNDLEHMALQLLLRRDADGMISRTALAETLAARYAHVLVDEYQDTNATQDALFCALSREESNLFMVGDVKQSIYGFRHAMPAIFVGRRDRYPVYQDGGGFPATITLGNNFRSRLEVTDSINFMFRQLMTRETCGIAYDEREELVQSANYPSLNGYETELLIIDADTLEEQETADVAEARVIAARIQECIQTLSVYENGRSRPATYGDFCVLLRSKSSHASAFVDELNRLGIPAWTDRTDGFFAAPEVSQAISLLRFLSNPIQDVPLLSLLMSPAFGFTPDMLAHIRAGSPAANLYTALQRSSRGNDAVAKRCHQFLETVSRWRTLAVTMPADRLLDRLYEESGLLAAARARRHGELRVANLRRLCDYARRFEHGGFRGLSAFVRYLDQMEEQGLDMPPASLVSENAHVVHVMSIHHSKGLEFPFVFLAGLGHSFNRSSSQGAMLLHADAGLGLIRREEETLLEFRTLPKSGVELAIRQSDCAEELRVLYVAMTRAREKLFLLMTLSDPEKTLCTIASPVGEGATLPSHAVADANGLGEWILMAVLRHPTAAFLRKLAADDDLPLLPADTTLRVEVLRAPTPITAEEEKAIEIPPDMTLMEEVSDRLQYTYPYAALGRIPAKSAASELAHDTLRRRFVAASRPAFLTENGLTPAERGTALHTFMQHARYDRAAADPQEEIARLVERAFLTRQQADSLPLGRIRNFFSSDLYRRIAASPNCMRELAFTAELPPALFFNEAETIPSGETMLVQGIADCVFEESGEFIIVDYKTDRVSDAADLIARYQTQLAVYHYALSQILDKPIRSCLLYSFSLGKTITCPIEKIV